MMNKGLIFFLLATITLISCNKFGVHSGLTRIDYEVTDPNETSGIYFELDETYNMNRFTNFEITLIADENAAELSLTIMLEDNVGNQTDLSPFRIIKSQITKDGQSHSYSYEFKDNLQSTTGENGLVDPENIKKVVIHINSGILGSAAEGYFWLDKINFTSSDK